VAGALVADRVENRVLVPATDGPPPRPPSDIVWTLGGETMGTTWSARVIAAPGAIETAYADAVQAELDAVVALFSPWIADSEISRFNTAPAGPVALSEPFWALLQAAMDLSDDTDGAVDPTLGALVDLWGFGPPGPRDPGNPVPDDAEVEAAQAVSGWRGLRLDRASHAALQPGGLRLDFSAIAKGRAVDRISERLTALGATSHLIEVGGELRGEGVKPDGQPWWVELEQPPAGDAPRTVVACYGLSVATSGDYRRYFGHDGRLFSHSIDGRTGAPIQNGLASVTVLHPSAMQADAFATALTVMGPDEGPAFAADMKLAARFMVHHQGGLIEVLSPAFIAMMDDA